jgi:lipopolysaccharide transport system ATP-binding protein
MSDIAIKVEGLGKRYKIGHLQRPDTLRDRIGNSRYFRLLKRRNGNSSNGNSHHATIASNSSNQSDTIWALKDVSFEVKRGEVVGIIGRNGAGKSTLLKILSRITEPTEGYADIHGRIASLLEVGTGFQPELTGRENIYLNGSILGMKHAEIRRKFDEIVAFAEIEQFIDTPVKHYSSGMYVRLAFAVAAHLDPEILLVDEVLAVGDSAFRKKCLGKMDDVAKAGRTILFVSHDMTSIASLCRRAILFEAGSVLRTGPPGEVIADYLLEDHSAVSTIQWNDLDEAPGDETVRLAKVEIRADDSGAGTSFSLSEPIQLLMEFRVLRPGMRLNPVFVVKNYLGNIVFSTANYEEPGWSNCEYEAGYFKTSCLIPGHILNEGQYSVDALLVHETRAVRAQADAIVSFTIFDDGTTRGDYLGAWLGIVRPRCEWQTESF